MEYLDFDLEIGIGNGLEYPLSVRSPAGEAHETMLFPYNRDQLQLHLKDLTIALLQSSSIARQVLPYEQQSVQNMGKDFYNALFTGDVRSRYDLSLRIAQEQNKGLRVRLRIQSGEISSLPWEYLYDPRSCEFLALSNSTPLVRYLEVPQIIRSIELEMPLRILGMICSPSDLPALDVNLEKKRVDEALADLQSRGLVEIDWLQGETWSDLQDAMLEGPWHVFHFIGHGDFNPQRDEGYLALTGVNGKARHIYATELARLLADHRELRLVVLNACRSAHSSWESIYSSTAAVLVRRGIACTIAMQFSISDGAAVELARRLYANLAKGLPVDLAITEVRKSLSIAFANSVEWGTPVLFMRSPDGKLFETSAFHSEKPLQDNAEQKKGDEKHTDFQKEINIIEPSTKVLINMDDHKSLRDNDTIDRLRSAIIKLNRLSIDLRKSWILILIAVGGVVLVSALQSWIVKGNLGLALPPFVPTATSPIPAITSTIAQTSNFTQITPTSNMVATSTLPVPTNESISITPTNINTPHIPNPKPTYSPELMKSFKKLGEFPNTEGAYSPDGKYLILLSREKNISKLQISDPINKVSYGTVDFENESSSYDYVGLGPISPDGQRLVVYTAVYKSQQYKINVYQLSDLKLVYQLDGYKSQYSPNGEFFITVQEKSTSSFELNIWKMPDKRHLLTRTFEHHLGNNGESIQLVFSHDSKRLALSTTTTKDKDSQITIIDLGTKDEIFSYKESKGPVNSLKFSFDGNYLLAVYKYYVINILDINNNKLKKAFRTSDHLWASGDFSPNSAIAILQGIYIDDSNGITIYDYVNDRKLCNISRPTNSQNSLHENFFVYYDSFAIVSDVTKCGDSHSFPQYLYHTFIPEQSLLIMSAGKEWDVYSLPSLTKISVLPIFGYRLNISPDGMSAFTFDAKSSYSIYNLILWGISK